MPHASRSGTGQGLPCYLTPGKPAAPHMSHQISPKQAMHAAAALDAAVAPRCAQTWVRLPTVLLVHLHVLPLLSCRGPLGARRSHAALRRGADAEGRTGRRPVVTLYDVVVLLCLHRPAGE